MISFFNTPTGKKEQFSPVNDGQVTLYTCGPTVYDDLTVGNWAAYIRWDILVRTLESTGYAVERVMNITDVGHLVSDADEGEDKMEKGARREGASAWDISRRYEERFLDGMRAFGMKEPQHLARATDYIPQQIELIQRLEELGHTYRIDDGIYFDTSTFERYADFAHLDLAALKAGARVTHSSQKRNPGDFALWKFSPADRTRDMEWQSPWGAGFPGWHIECSAIALNLLGDTLDIHTGGIDHIPVHHSNEVAQSEAATGHPFAHYWLHSNFLLVNGTKISKSLGNGFTLDDITDHGFSPDDFRMFVLQSHYRSESNFTWENLHAAANRLRRWREVAELRWQLHGGSSDSDPKKTKDYFTAIVADDLNTPELLSAIDAHLDLIAASPASYGSSSLTELLTHIEALTGLHLLDATPDITEEEKQLLNTRQRARDKKDYATSDTVRETLAARGIYLKDTVTGQSWTRQAQ